ncbi:MAG: FecR family protein [Spirochaetota bacterium]
MIALKKQVMSFAVITAAMLIAFSGCGKKEANEKAVVTFVLGEVTIQRKSDIRKAEVRDVLTDGDIVVTGEKSYIVVQMGDALVFRVEAESKMEIGSITEYGKNELNLTEGLVLSKLAKLKKGEQYIIKTPTATASVRGTVFFTEYNNSVAKVAVAEGKVNIKHLSSEKETQAEADAAAVVTDSINTRKTDTVEKLILRKIQETAVIENINSIGKEQLENEGNRIFENDIRIDKKIDKLLKKSMTLDEIKSEYGRVDVVKLYTGKIYRGAILSRGNKVKMITPDGTIEIESKSIKQTGSR